MSRCSASLDDPSSTRPRELLKLKDFFTRFALDGDTQLAHIPHPRFSFRLDGWAAAVALADPVLEFERNTPHGQVALLLLEKQIDPAEWTIESLASWPTNYVDHGFSDWIVQDLASYWFAVCRKAYPRIHYVPEERIFSRTSVAPGNNHREHKIKHREPLALPFAPDSTAHFVRTTSGKHAPASAIFFAARFYRLRCLDRKLSQLSKLGEKGYRETRLTHENVYSVLLSIVLYFTSPRVHGLVYDYSSWKLTYDEGQWCGNEVFGVKDGFDLNIEFLERFLPRALEWFTGAANWWIDGTDHKANDDRKLLIEASMEMVGELEMILNRSRIGMYYPRFVTNPFAPVSR